MQMSVARRRGAAQRNAAQSCATQGCSPATQLKVVQRGMGPCDAAQSCGNSDLIWGTDLNKPRDIRRTTLRKLHI
mgnify:CR=1 FL=1